MGPSRCYTTIINIFIELVDEFCVYFVLAHADLSTSRALERGARSNERGAGALARSFERVARARESSTFAAPVVAELDSVKKCTFGFNAC